MGLFFNYDKPGPGVDKDAPKKKGIFLYLELFFRKFWLLIRANMLYFLVSIPVIALYNIIITNILGAFFPELDQSALLHISVIITVFVTVYWGTGPVTGGYVYLLRNFAREEHVFLASDFFEKSKECFKIGIVTLIIDIAVLILGSNAISIYYAMSKQGMEFAKYAIAVMIVMFTFYTFAHYYIYEFAVTFENKVFATIKNALITAIATLPANLFLTLFGVALTFFAFYPLTVFAIILLLFIIWISLLRFPVDFYAARMIKRRFIDK